MVKGKDACGLRLDWRVAFHDLQRSALIIGCYQPHEGLHCIYAVSSRDPNGNEKAHEWALYTYKFEEEVTDATILLEVISLTNTMYPSKAWNGN